MRILPLALLFSLSFLAACQPSNDSALGSDNGLENPSFSLNKEPNSNELYLKSFSPTINSNPGLTKAEVSGECFISTYSTHRIVAKEGTQQLDILDLNPSTDVNTPAATCKNGKFNLVINTGVLANGVHSIRLILEARDSNNQVVVNDVQGTTTITLTK